MSDNYLFISIFMEMARNLLQGFSITHTKGQQNHENVPHSRSLHSSLSLFGCHPVFCNSLRDLDCSGHSHWNPFGSGAGQLVRCTGCRLQLRRGGYDPGWNRIFWHIESRRKSNHANHDSIHSRNDWRLIGQRFLRI